MESMRVASLILATLAVGVMAGVMALYANTIMPGLRRTDDRTFVGSFQAIDTAIINPLFLATFFGGLVFTGIAAALHLGEDHRSVLPWIVVAFGLYLAVIVIRVAVNVPLNDQIKAAGDPDGIDDLAEVREQFEVGPLEPRPSRPDRGSVRVPGMGSGAPRSCDLATHRPGQDGHITRCELLSCEPAEAQTDSIETLPLSRRGQ